MNRLISILIVFLLLVCMPTTGYAQSADASYNQGLELMKSKRYSEAIQSFQKSIIINGSQKNKTRCNNKIKECRKKMKDAPKQIVEHKPFLSVSEHEVNFGAEQVTRTLKVSASPDTSGWTYESHGDWFNIEKADKGQSLKIICDENTIPLKRDGLIILSCNELKDTIHIFQKPAPVFLTSEVDTLVIEMKKQSKNIFKRIIDTFIEDKNYVIMFIPVETNSPVLYEDKRPWTVLFSHDWVSEAKDIGDLNKVQEFLVDYLKKRNENIENQTWETLKNRLLIVKIDKMTKKHPSFLFGRTAEITLRTEDSLGSAIEHKILVRQLGKDQTAN